MDEDIVIHQSEKTSEVKLISLWVLGSIFMFIASWLAGHIEWTYGTDKFSFWFSVSLSFILFLAGSFIWIVTAILASQNRY